MIEESDDSTMPPFWVVERTGNRRFPYRISIEQGGRLVAAFRAQSRWPGPGQQIFCLRERELDPAEALEPVERVPVANVSRIGRKLALVLDRPNRKRCEFLTVEKARKDNSGTYEQIYFRTESGIRAHRSGSRVELREPPAQLTVLVDSGERYPWRFPGADTERRKLSVGDYALLQDGRVAAVVERKSYEHLLTEVSAVQALHQQLADLASRPPSALVIEAEYRDFLDPKRVKGRWPTSFLQRFLAELSALHPTLPIIYAGNRKLANLWTQQFFQAVTQADQQKEPQLALEIAAGLDLEENRPRQEEEIRRMIHGELAAGFTLADLAARWPDLPEPRLKARLEAMRRRGELEKEGRGKQAVWRVRRANP
ncbi:MAG: ERCC4 domain-containing protein [Gemmatimonadales bacterium]